MNARAPSTLEDIVVDLLLRSPFFGHVLAGIDKRLVAGGSATFRPSGAKIVLEVGEELLARATRAQARGILKHELMHLVLEHPERKLEFRDGARFDLAADLVVGTLLDGDERGPWDRVPDDFPNLDLPPEATVDVYYQLLPPLVSGEDEEGRSGPGSRGTGEAPRDHDTWGDLLEGSPVELQLRAALLRNLIEDAFVASRRIGALPSLLERLVKEILGRSASVPWHVVVRRFRNTSDRTRVIDTIHRVSRRYGTVPGTRVRRLSRLVACVDTSGSISAEELGAFSVELRHLARTGSEIWVVYCDAAVQGEEPFRGALPDRVPGGGGTSFDPALRAARDRHPDGIVYLTDGYGPPVKEAVGCPVLWVLTPGGRDPATAETRETLPGRVVRMR
jgi:predicted metal-dependent peptidase